MVRFALLVCMATSVDGLRFAPGDAVTDADGETGIVVAVDTHDPDRPYELSYTSGAKYWASEASLSPGSPPTLAPSDTRDLLEQEQPTRAEAAEQPQWRRQWQEENGSTQKQGDGEAAAAKTQAIAPACPANETCPAKESAPVVPVVLAMPPVLLLSASAAAGLAAWRLSLLEPMLRLALWLVFVAALATAAAIGLLLAVHSAAPSAAPPLALARLLELLPWLGRIEPADVLRDAGARGVRRRLAVALEKVRPAGRPAWLRHV